MGMPGGARRRRRRRRRRGRRMGTSGPAGCELGSWARRAPAWPGPGLQEPGGPAHVALARMCMRHRSIETKLRQFTK